MASPKKVTVEVHIVKDSTKPPPEKPYSFWLEPKDKKLGGKGNDLIFNGENLYDGFEIDFDLVDETGEGFYFMDIGKKPNGEPDPDLAPMWVKTVKDLSEPCPDREFWDGFVATKLVGNNTTLKVRNANSTVQKFKFAFMFSTTPHQGPYQIMYDPGGLNQNSNATTKSPLVAVAVVIGVVALAGFVAYELGVFSN